MNNDMKPINQPELSEQDAELLSAYLDNMLAHDERQQLEKRLEDNDFLRGELDAMRQTVALFNVLPTLKAPRDFTITAADVALPVQSEKIIRLKPRNNLWYLASAAALVIVVIGIAIVLPISNQSYAPVGALPESVANNPTQAINQASDMSSQARSITITPLVLGGGAANSEEATAQDIVLESDGVADDAQIFSTSNVDETDAVALEDEVANTTDSDRTQEMTASSVLEPQAPIEEESETSDDADEVVIQSPVDNVPQPENNSYSADDSEISSPPIVAALAEFNTLILQFLEAMQAFVAEIRQ